MKEWEETKEQNQERSQGVEAALTFYMEELADMEEITQEEEERLFPMFRAGDTFAQKRYIEGNLKKVIRLAADYIGKGVPLGDLIQEGNMALVMATAQFEGESKEEWRSYLEAEIIVSMEAVLSGEEQKEKIAKKIADRANLVSEVSKNLADELGREATAEEIAERLSTTVENVKEIMKISLDALSVMAPGVETSDGIDDFRGMEEVDE